MGKGYGDAMSRTEHKTPAAFFFLVLTTLLVQRRRSRRTQPRQQHRIAAHRNAHAPPSSSGSQPPWITIVCPSGRRTAECPVRGGGGTPTTSGEDHTHRDLPENNRYKKKGFVLFVRG